MKTFLQFQPLSYLIKNISHLYLNFILQKTLSQCFTFKIYKGAKNNIITMWKSILIVKFELSALVIGSKLKLKKYLSFSSHCYFTRLNPKRISPFQFCFPALLGIHRKIVFEIQQRILEKILFILSDKHLDRAGQSLRLFLNKFKQWHFHSPSK